MTYEQDRQVVRMLVRAREDFQAMRKRMDNRIGRKANGDAQNIEERTMRPEDVAMFQGIADEARKMEAQVEKDLNKVLKRFPVYTEFLAKVNGVGPIAAGWIVGEYDIHKATTVSKLWQFTGLNSGMVQGKKRVENEDGTFSLVSTGEMVRGDKLTPGHVAPFNKRLRTAMVGVLADGFIKSGLRWREIPPEEFVEDTVYCKMKDGKPMAAVISTPQVREYMAEKERVLHKEGWKEESPGHRDRHAKRKMIKGFLRELYNAWRALEGLHVRETYQEEYLGHKHASRGSEPV